VEGGNDLRTTVGHRIRVTGDLVEQTAGPRGGVVDLMDIGTAAMATLEATTAPEVKQMLVDTPGTPDWVGAGTATGGM
ncbi:fatty acid synthase subunit beta domain-containing protein, partial [Nocardia cyriacigeorgica]|uniref:fatty acid synthase subunit beta domain-containing protein n=1 Tax=Nocardia cyriacigeorgica TaxID=135487 RepID=UPI002114FE57